MKQSNSRRAVLLARVSTPEQERFGQSLETQVVTLREYAARHGIEIVEEFVFQESAGQGIRQRFEQVMRYLKTHSTVNILLAQNVDRVTRNFRDAVDVDEMRLRDGLEIHFVQENLVINAQSSGVEMAVWDVRVFAGRQLLLRMRDQAMSDHRRQARDGKWAFKAPLGYLNKRDAETGKCSIVVDPERAPLIQKIFEEYATGLWSIKVVAEHACSNGLTSMKGKPISAHSVDRMLRNAFYCGIMTMKGEEHIHQYERLVSPTLFERCGKVLTGRAKNPPKLQGRSFVFRGLLRCAASGRAVSTDAKLRRYTDGSTQEFVYLTPRDPENTEKRMWVREGVVLDQAGNALDELVFPEDLIEALLPAVEEACSEGQSFYRHANQSLKQQLEAVDQQLGKLTDLVLKDLISEDELRKKRSELLTEQRRLTESVTENKRTSVGHNRLKSAMGDLLQLSSKLAGWFAGSTIEQKRKILSFVFSNLRLNGRNLEYTLNSPFDRLASAGVPGMVAHEDRVANLLEFETRIAILEIVPKLQELASEFESTPAVEGELLGNHASESKVWEGCDAA